MTEITRVPLQPIERGALSKLWLAVVAIALLAVGLAWWLQRPSTLNVQTLAAGQGPSPTEADIVLVNYKGSLPNGTVFEERQQVPMQMQGLVPGFSKALKQMQRGGKYKVLIPAAEAYGANPPQGSPIPANSDLLFDIELLDFKSKAEVEAMMKQAQAEQAKQGKGAGSPRGMPAMPPMPGQMQ